MNFMKKYKAPYFKLLIIFSLVAILSITFQVNKNRYIEIARQIELFTTIFKHLEMYYVDEIKPKKLIKKCIDKMLSSLDPYTVYMDKDQSKEFDEITEGKYGGIGCIIGAKDSCIVVRQVYKDSPCDKEGLKVGDIILAIDDKDISKITNISEASNLIKGNIKTIVKLKVKRFNKKDIFNIVIERGIVETKAVPYANMISDKIGLVTLMGFSKTSANEVKQAFLKLKKMGMQKFILDLRGNSGGLLSQAVNIISFFVPKGTIIVSTKGKISKLNKTYKTENIPLDLDIPIVVLVDSNSASSSEILSGALQDLDRAVIVGEKTYGKGLVQQLIPVNQGQLKLTVSKYYIPSGRCIQKVDYFNEIKQNDNRTRKLFYTKSGRVVYENGGVTPDIKIAPAPAPIIVDQLYANDIIFNYATEYYYNHKKIKLPKYFFISNKEYKVFVEFVKKQKVIYKTKKEKKLEEFINLIKEDERYNLVKKNLVQIKKQLYDIKENDIFIYEKYIKKVLAADIISRYYYQSGTIEFKINHDMVFAKAKEIFKSNQKYQKILGSRK